MADKTKAPGDRAKRARRIWTDLEKEGAIALFTTTGNLSRVSRETGVPISTLKGWLNEQPSEKVKEAREDAKMRFVSEAWDTISKAVATGNTVMSFALENKGRIDEAIKVVLGSQEISVRHKGAVVSALLDLTKFDMRELANYIGVVYDKIALATDKPTGIQRVDGQVTHEHEHRLSLTLRGILDQRAGGTAPDDALPALLRRGDSLTS